MTKSLKKNKPKIYKNYFSNTFFIYYFGFIAFGVYLIVIGSKYINLKNTKTSIVTGTVTDKPIFCSINTNKYVTKYSTSIICNPEVAYTINNINYKKIFNTSGIYYKPNDQIELYYDPNNIENIVAGTSIDLPIINLNDFEDDYYYSSLFSIIFGVLLIIFILIVIYFLHINPKIFLKPMLK